MNYTNIVKVEGDKTIPLTDKYLHAGPMSMGEIEWYEDRVDQDNFNYLLAQVDTTVDGRFGQQYKRGYCLFVRKKKSYKKD